MDDERRGVVETKKYQTTKESISEILSGFNGEGGVDIYTGKAWDYAGLCKLYTDGIEAMPAPTAPDSM